MENREPTNLKRVGFDAVRYVASLFFLYLVFLQLKSSWEVIFFIFLAIWLQLGSLEIPYFGGLIYPWYLWSLLFSSNLSNAIITLCASFFFQRSFKLKNWRYHFDRFINLLLPFSLFSFVYLYLSALKPVMPFRFFLFLLLSQFFWFFWFFLDGLGEELVFRPSHSFRTLVCRSVAGAGIAALLAVVIQLAGLGGALALLLLIYLAGLIYQEIKEKEGIFERNLELISAIEKELLHQPEQTRRVINEALALGKSVHLSKKELLELRKAALFHNIGMLKTASFINREGRLEEREFEKLKEHTRIFGDKEDGGKWVKYVFHHHEHFDGTGYPEGVIGESIPLPARILSLAQAFVALTSPRPYRGAFLEDEALEELKRGEGTKYDAVLLRAYARIKKEKENVEKEL